MDIYNVTSQEILDRISRHCPDSLSSYLSCINLANQEGNLFFSRDYIDRTMSISYTKLRNRLKKLALENLLEWHEINGGLHVILAVPDDE